jgi:hypothetical protein
MVAATTTTDTTRPTENGRHVSEILYYPKETAFSIGWDAIAARRRALGSQMHVRQHPDGGISITLFWDDGIIIETPVSARDPKETYEVRAQRPEFFCNCKGFNYRGTCKHVTAARAAA